MTLGGLPSAMGILLVVGMAVCVAIIRSCQQTLPQFSYVEFDHARND